MSLPIIEYQNGMAEVIKHAIIGNRKLWDMLQDPEQIDPETMIIKSIRVKAHIVNQDFKEESTRMLLNFGHTFGHAIEKASNYEIKHGHAVGIGMVKAAQYAIKNNLCKDLDLDKKIIKILKTHGLPAEYAESEKQDIWELMQGDKKRMGKILRLILPKEINDVFRFDCAV